jgi:drug/metabolite transporter (DMT)-like permease
MRQDTAAKLACAYSGLVWGLYWMPLRALAGAGIEGMWAILIFYAVPLVFVVPLALWRWRVSLAHWRPSALGLLAALGLVPYSIGVLETEVVKAMLLFYLTPIWSTLLARLFLGEAITPVRWLALASGLAGMVVILRSESGLPWPANFGDWMALASGIVWAVTATIYRADNGRTSATELWCHNFIWSAAVSVIAIPLLGLSWADMPSLETYGSVLWWLVPSVVVLVMTGTYATMWGAPKLNPGLVGLLFMTEISVGAVTAAIWAGEPFGWREAIGIVLITGAGLIESVADLRRGMRASQHVSTTQGLDARERG